MACVALTFDDGPDPVWTPRLLDRLAQIGAHATFFPIARRAAEHPEVIKRTLAEGHAVGLHCDQHVRHGDRSEAWVRADTERALDRLRRLGVRPRMWRTPWGERAPFTPAIAREFELELVGWTADTHDWRGDPAETMFAMTRPALRDGAIVLAHDGLGPGALRTGAAQTITYASLVGAYAQRRGLALKTLV
jgi:peptidoglycan-N-acetylglucosamine deacetylase